MTEHRGVEIEGVEPGSLAERLGFRIGDRILKIDKKRIRDIIDVIYYAQESASEVELLRRKGRLTVAIPQREGKETFYSGLTFKPFRIRTCKNHCIFCFVSQLPKGLRRSLYVRDEDYRMSFLYGNYITLTNLSQEDRQRIVTQNLSPLYISVHVTDDEKRRYMLGNREAPPIMEQLRFFAKHRIRMHTQIVLCPGINDGTVLERTLLDLYGLYPYVMSIAVVPVGLTIHRKRQLKPFDRAVALDTIRIVERYQTRFRRKHGESIVYAADELYIKAERPFPKIEHYDELPQLENGVGMVPSFLHRAKKLKIKRLLATISAYKPLNILTFTGESFYAFLEPIIAQLRAEGVKIHCLKVQNHFFGDTVTVTGLITGRDVIRALADVVSHSTVLLIPDVCLKEGEQLFLDDVSVSELEGILRVKAKVIESTPEGLLSGIEWAYKNG